jgi:hypothetical protein
MTYDRFEAILDGIRRSQGTKWPLVQVRAGGSVVRGRVARIGAEAAGPHNPDSPYGILVLEQPGLGRGPASRLQIASIPDDGLSGIE